MDKKIIDGMKKESKVSMYLMVIGYIFAVLILLISYKSKDKGDVLLAIMWFIIGTFGLYTWLCAIKYKIEINDKHISLKTLFIKKEINITDIEKYKCNKYRRTALYKFNLYINGKKVLICTRYKEKFENILSDNNVQKVVRWYFKILIKQIKKWIVRYYDWEKLRL